MLSSASRSRDKDGSGAYEKKAGSTKFIHGFMETQGTKRLGWMSLHALVPSDGCSRGQPQRRRATLRAAMTYAFPAPPTPSVAIAGESVRFPVRRILCVGRNYAAHAREMGRDPDREPPFFFAKPADAVVDAGADLGARIPYPPLTSNLQHEVELVVAIGVGGSDIARERALEHAFGYAVGFDLTRRDLQNAAKEKGQPWEWGKGFDRSAPLAPIHRAAVVGHPAEGRIWAELDGAPRQQGDLREMIWPVPDVIAIASRSMALAPGDLIFTGTPAGVGPIAPGQTVRGGVAGLGDVAITIEAR